MTTAKFVAARPDGADRILDAIDSEDLTVGETIWLVCIILEVVSETCDGDTMRVMLDAITSHVQQGRPSLREREQQLLEDEAVAAEDEE